MFRRRRESAHQRLAREAGLSLEPEAPPAWSNGFQWAEVGIHGVARPREWDAVATVETDAPRGDTVGFVALPDRTLVTDDDEPDGALALLAEAVERTLSPPYRAEAVRKGASRWAVAARAIEVAELPEEVSGQEIELVAHEDERTLRIDGSPAFGSLRELERVGHERFRSFALHARRLDGTLWEVRVDPL